MQKFQFDYFSDIHIDSYFKTSGDFLSNALIDKQSNNLIIAGDVGNGRYWNDYFEEFVKQKYNGLIVTVDGNHDLIGENFCDYYGEEKTSLIVVKMPSLCGTHYINVASFTLWPILNPIEEYVWQKNVIDSRHIRGITAELMTEITQNDIVSLLNFPEKIHVVVTHFPPSRECFNPKYPPDDLTPYFCPDFPELVEKISPMMWIYGHNHYQFDNVSKINNHTRLLSYPIGYRKELRRIPIVEGQYIFPVETAFFEIDGLPLDGTP